MTKFYIFVEKVVLLWSKGRESSKPMRKYFFKSYFHNFFFTIVHLSIQN